MNIEKNNEIPSFVQNQNNKISPKIKPAKSEEKKTQANAQDGLATYGKAQINLTSPAELKAERYKEYVQKELETLYPNDENTEKIIKEAQTEEIEGFQILEELLKGPSLTSKDLFNEIREYLWVFKNLYEDKNVHSTEIALKLIKDKIQKENEIKKIIENNKYAQTMLSSGKYSLQNLKILATFLTPREFKIATILGNSHVCRKEVNSKNGTPIDTMMLMEEAGLYRKLSEYINQDNINKLMKDGVFLYDAVTINYENDIRELYEKFLEEGNTPKTASILANINNINDYDTEDIKNLINSVSRISETSESDIANAVQAVLEIPDMDLKSFNEYISKINIINLIKAAPTMANFKFEEMMTFLSHHYKLNPNKTTFNKDELNYGNLTDYIKHNVLYADKLTDILSKYPNTPREIGELPEDWLNNIPEEERSSVKEGVYNAISEFQETKYIPGLENNLTKILGKKTKIDPEGHKGTFGTVYQISVEGAEDKALKIFHTETIPMRDVHGEHIEPQMGLFTNQHSNDFVKMYCGRISGMHNSDSFLLSQYLSKDTIPYNQTASEDGYVFISNDLAMNNNVINKKIIDFGDVDVYKLND